MKAVRLELQLFRTDKTYVQALVYNGIFKIEDEDSIHGRLSRTDKKLGFPSIGVFDESCLETVQVVHGFEHFLELSYMKDIFRGEVKYFKRELYKIYQEYQTLNPRLVQKLLKELEDTYPLLQQKDVLDILNTFDPNEIKQELNEEQYIKRLRFGIRSPFGRLYT